MLVSKFWSVALFIIGAALLTVGVVMGVVVDKYSLESVAHGRGLGALLSCSFVMVYGVVCLMGCVCAIFSFVIGLIFIFLKLLYWTGMYDGD